MIDPNVLLTQGISAGTVVWIIQELKKAGWCKSLSMDSARVNRIVSAIAALLTASAIHWTWDSASHVLTISGLTLSAVAGFLWGAFQQFVGQEYLYQAVYAPKEAARQALAVQVAAQIGSVSQATKAVTTAIENK